MRFSFTRNLVFGFAFGSIGAASLAGTASARPERDHVLPTVREGTPPANVMKAEIMLRASHDGRGETNAGDLGSARRDPAFTTPDKLQVDGRLDPLPAFALPFKADIKNHVQMRDDGSDPKSVALRSNDSTASRGGMNTYAAPSRQAPLPIKMDILLKLEAGEDSLINPVARPEDKRATRSRDSDPRSLIGDASQAELRDPRTYPGREENVPSVAQMFSGRALHTGGNNSGDASTEKTP